MENGLSGALGSSTAIGQAPKMPLNNSTNIFMNKNVPQSMVGPSANQF